MKYMILVLLVVSTVLCYADLPQTMSYQGVLTDNDGDPVADGSYTVVFGIHDSPGTRYEGSRAQLWSETQTITVTNGQFRAVLGSVNPLNLPFDVPYWLAITVNGSTLSPYSELTSVPFSFYSRNSTNADSLNGQPGSYYNNWSNLNNVPSGFADGTDNVGSILYDAVVSTSGGDYTSLEAAIAAGHKTIFIKKGTYTNSTVLTLPTNCVIVGESWAESIIAGSAMNSTGLVTLKNIKLICQGGTYLGERGTFEHIWIETTSNVAITTGNLCLIKDCYLNSNQGIITGSQCSVEGNYILSNTMNCQFGIYNRIIGNFFDSSSATDAIRAGQKSVINNNILICSSINGTGIYATPGCIVSNNRLEGFNDGMCLWSTNDDTTCNGNIVKSCGGKAFRIIAGSSSDLGIMTLTGNIAWQPGNDGFYFMAASHTYLSNNTVYGAGRNGFYISTSSEDIQINGNSARYCVGKGFEFYGNVSPRVKWNVSNNQAISNGSDGFRMYLQNSAISGNISVSNSGVGFSFSSGLCYCSFTGNNTDNNTSGGFFTTGSPALNCSSIDGNVIRDGFEVSGQNLNSVISNNVFFGASTSFGTPQTNSVIANNVQ